MKKLTDKDADSISGVSKIVGGMTPRKKKVDEIEKIMQLIAIRYSSDPSTSGLLPSECVVVKRRLRALVRRAHYLGWAHAQRPLEYDLVLFKEIFGVRP